MPVPVDREATFNATITDFGLKEMDSGAIAIAIRCTLDEIWNGEGWQPWSEYDMEAEGDLWIVKKDNQGINDGAAKSLIANAGWDGNLESIADGTWQPSRCSVSIKRDEYKGVGRFKISFVNPLNKIPGGLSNVDSTKAKSLQARYGPQFRALAGNTQRNESPPTGTPAPPPPAPAGKLPF